MPRLALLPGILFLASATLLSAAPTEPTLSPLVRTVDLGLGESTQVELCNGTKVQVKLLDLKETRDSIRDAVRIARVQVEVDGQKVWLTSGNYNLPVTCGKAQIDCPITKGPTTNSNGDHWGLEKDARVRLWPAGSPLFLGKFVYPVKQRWFVSATQMANEPVFNNAEETQKVRNIYYHYGLDFGGAEILTEVVAATDGLVVSAGTAVLPGYKDTPVAIRYDVIYLLDAQGWYYRYSHLHSFAEGIKAGVKVKAGQKLGMLGKEGASGGWSHLHLDIFCRQPSGKWGCQEAYCFVWEAYRKQYDPKLVAVARPHHFLAAGETALLDGGKSWSADGKIVRYQWTFTDGTTAEGAQVKRQYAHPGYYSEILKVTDAAGRSDYDFAVVVVAERDHPERVAPALHVAYYPSLAVHAGDTVTFKARMFAATQGQETWDFGDGTPKAVTQSSRSAEPHAKDGYAVITHRYERPGDYLVRVERNSDHGWPAIARVHVPVKADTQQLTVTAENASGVHRLKAPIRWRVEVSGVKPETKIETRYEVLKDGAAKPIDAGEIRLDAGRGAVETSLSEPGTLMVNVSAQIGDKRLTKQVGAAVAPEGIRPSMPCPADFDAFWKAKIESLRAVPMNARVEQADGGKDVDYYKVRMDNIRGTHIYGQLAKPKRAGKFPAMLVVQWAGVYGLSPWLALGPAKEGFLTLNIMPHDLPFDKPPAFYDEAAKTTHKNYWQMGRESRETSYFLRMFLGCYRAADFLTERPDWDGKTLLVSGVSQGGYQSLATAALHPKITAMIALAPGGCDIAAPLSGRGDSFPFWLTGWPRAANQQAAVEAGRYFDIVNFAPRIKCPAFVSLGLLDTACRPGGVYAAFNQIPGPKEVLVQPDAIHDGAGLPRCQARTKAWRQALLKGEPLPPPLPTD